LIPFFKGLGSGDISSIRSGIFSKPFFLVSASFKFLLIKLLFGQFGVLDQRICIEKVLGDQGALGEHCVEGGMA
jgi:hypothetical protein